MARVKRGTTAAKRRRNILREVKGFRGGRKSKERLAKEALLKAWTYATRDRKLKKRDFRRLWQVKINAAAREADISYSKLIAVLKKTEIRLDRKILAHLAEHHPKIFKQMLSEIRK
jgi:large subunit ribosomal protein L20